MPGAGFTSRRQIGTFGAGVALVKHNRHLWCRGRCGLDLIKGAGFGAGAAQTLGTKGSGVGAGAGQAQFQFSFKSITACPTILIAVILA